MERKLVIFDVDGTITGKQGVPESAAAAIRKIRENGDIAVMFTGRPYAHTENAVLDIGFDAYICTMGAYIRYGDTVAQDIVPSPEITAKVVRLVRECKLDCCYEYSKGIAFDPTRAPAGPLPFLKKMFGERGLEIDADIDAPGFAFEKVCVWMNDESDYDRFEREIQPDLVRIGRKQNMAEFVAPGISVQESVNAVIAHFGISHEKTYSIGDSINDLPFLSCAAHSSCMGQATDDLKEKVEYVTDEIYSDGLAKAMKHFGLI